MMRCLLLVAVFFSSCSFPGFDLELVPGVTHVDELAFSVSYPNNPQPVLCRAIEAYSAAFEAESLRQEWKARASKPLPCPNPLKWGQDLGKGWEVLTAAKPLERNRRYELILYSDKGEKEWLYFCVFQEGSIVVNYYAYRTTELEGEQMVQCLKEGEEEPEGEEAPAAP